MNEQILLLFLIFCSFLCLYRVFRGPTLPDRAAAFNILGMVVVAACALEAHFTQRAFLIDIAIAWTLQSCIVVLALAKYIEGKHFDE